MKYPDFVAKTGQVNTPPGSYDTIKTWIREGFITKESNVLEIGCNTGFISYQIHSYTKARTTGIDISEEAIKKARNYCKDYKNIKFLIASAEKIPFKDETFTHVVLGGHLPLGRTRKKKTTRSRSN